MSLRGFQKMAEKNTSKQWRLSDQIISSLDVRKNIDSASKAAFEEMAQEELAQRCFVQNHIIQEMDKAYTLLMKEKEVLEAEAVINKRHMTEIKSAVRFHSRYLSEITDQSTKKDLELKQKSLHIEKLEKAKAEAKQNEKEKSKA